MVKCLENVTNDVAEKPVVHYCLIKKFDCVYVALRAVYMNFRTSCKIFTCHEYIMQSYTKSYKDQTPCV